MKKKFFHTVLVFFCAVGVLKAQKHTVSGIISDRQSGELLRSATISSVNGKENTISNAYGYFSLTLPVGVDSVYITMGEFSRYLIAIDSSRKDVSVGNILLVHSTVKELETVIVKADGVALRRNVRSTQMGSVELPVALLKRVPSIAGEPDIIKALQLTPGVKRGGEGTIGMYIRGGGIDENLIVLDEATVYNAGHLLGFFSVFNTAALKDVQLYKSSFPVQYSGRLSGILDVQMKEGNMKKFEGDASIGIIASNITLQGPIIKDKTSFIVSARRTYLDAVTGGSIPYHFYDVNVKINHIIDPRNRIFFSLYKGDDILSITNSQESNSVGTSSSDIRSGLKLGNSIGSFRWNHLFKNTALFSNLSLIYTKFRYNIEGAFGNNSLLIASSIRDMGAKADISYKPGTAHSFLFGGQYIVHYFTPNIVSTTGAVADNLKNSSGKQIYNIESGIYANDEWKVSEKILMNTGLRLTADAVENKTYLFLEPRYAARYLINNKSSVKASYARMVQNMHLVSSSAIALPTDLWYPATKNIKPGISDQISIGYYRNVKNANISWNVEGYYKWLHNLIEYKEGASLVLNNNYENELVTGVGHAYGLEFFVSKTTGRLQGWVGYTLSYAFRKFDSLNAGKQFYSRFDRRHDASLVLSYTLSKRWDVSGNYVFSTGSPFTAQVSQFIAPSPTFTNIDVLPVYSSRNAVRLSGSQRIDLDFVYKFRPHGSRKAEIHFGCYNLLNAAQPGRVTRELNATTGQFEYKQKGLFGLVPSISYNIHF